MQELEDYKTAVEEAISENHRLGLPAYQSKNGYIIAIYPDGKEVKLQKVSSANGIAMIDTIGYKGHASILPTDCDADDVEQRVANIVLIARVGYL